MPIPTRVDISAAPKPSEEKPWPQELVCFVLLGRSARERDAWRENWQPGQPMYAEIVHQGKLLGRSYNLADTVELAFTTDQIEAVRKMVKTVGRIMVKEAIADAVERNQNDRSGRWCASF